MDHINVICAQVISFDKRAAYHTKPNQDECSYVESRSVDESLRWKRARCGSETTKRLPCYDEDCESGDRQMGSIHGGEEEGE